MVRTATLSAGDVVRLSTVKMLAFRFEKRLSKMLVLPCLRRAGRAWRRMLPRMRGIAKLRPALTLLGASVTLFCSLKRKNPTEER